MPAPALSPTPPSLPNTDLSALDPPTHLRDAQPSTLNPQPSTLLQRAAWTRDAEPVFLVGCPRSGTTWLQAMLAAHPEVYSGPETHFFRLYGPIVQEYHRTAGKHFGFPLYLDEAGFRRFLEASFWALISGLPEPPAPPRYLLEKTPDHAQHAATILSLFPNARFIHLVRDARAVVSSLLRGSRSWAHSWAPDNAEEATAWWLHHVQCGLGIQDMVASPDRYLGLRYEDLRRDPVGHLRHLFGWLKLPFDHALVNRIAAEHSLERARESREIPSVRNSQPLPEGFIGAGACQPDEFELSAEDRALVEERAGEMLAALGYGPDGEYPFEASVLVIGEGEDPAPVLQRVAAAAEQWQEGWELVLASRSGSACRQVAACLEGDFQLVSSFGRIAYGAALRSAAEAARGRDVILLLGEQLFRLRRSRLLALPGLAALDERSLPEHLAAAAV